MTLLHSKLPEKESVTKAFPNDNKSLAEARVLFATGKLPNAKKSEIGDLGKTADCRQQKTEQNWIMASV